MIFPMCLIQAAIYGGFDRENDDQPNVEVPTFLGKSID
jgi:hypothetical protein